MTRLPLATPPPTWALGRGKGRGKPLPEGEEGVLEAGRKISLDRLRPEGWRDFGERLGEEEGEDQEREAERHNYEDARPNL